MSVSGCEFTLVLEFITSSSSTICFICTIAGLQSHKGTSDKTVEETLFNCEPHFCI